MSHKATNWLSDLPSNLVGASEFRVLFHLCDCHNPSNGCYPTQAYLIDATGVSNGTLNNALNALERKGLIQRNRAFDGKTKRRKPTRYVLGFEYKKRQEPTPKIGDGANSNLDPKPSPVSGQSHLQPVGDKPVKEPVKNRAQAREAKFFTDDERFKAKQIVEHINGGGSINPEAISPRIRCCLLAEGMISKDVAERHEIAEKKAGGENG